MNYLELQFIIHPKIPGVDILTTLLAEQAFESFMETSDGLLAYIPEEHFNETFIHQIQENLIDIEFKYTKKLIAEQNWNALWESNFSPINVNNRCYIRAPFHPASGIDPEVIIEPKMSFGTGHHDTTFLMVQELLNLNLEEKSVLDMGCGTGILAILAAKRKAKSVTAIDIDRWAYRNTIENLVVNNIHDVIVHKGDVNLVSSLVFDVILANINKNILLADIPAYSKALLPGGNLLLSGFFATDATEMEQKANSFGLKIEANRSRNQWCLLNFTKLNS